MFPSVINDNGRKLDWILFSATAQNGSQTGFSLAQTATDGSQTEVHLPCKDAHRANWFVPRWQGCRNGGGDKAASRREAISITPCKPKAQLGAGACKK
jgi:hypothetical protein